jgi:hypothetical protein
MGCYYRLKLAKTHYIVTTVEQGEWVDAILAGINEVTINRPPIKWISKY